MVYDYQHSTKLHGSADIYQKDRELTVEEIIDAIGVEPYHVESAGIIYCADCMDILPKIPEKSIDLVVTDPPYGFNRFKTDGRDYLIKLRPAFDGIERSLKDGGSAFVFSNTRDIIEIGKIVPLSFYRLLWMYKPADCTYPLNGWLLTSEAIHWYTKGKPTNLIERKPYHHDCYIHNHVGQEGVNGHPTVKPISIIRDFVARCPNTGIISDPFLGSGTTAVAAKQLGRKFIGIEIEEKYCKIAVQRLAQEELF